MIRLILSLIHSLACVKVNLNLDFGGGVIGWDGVGLGGWVIQRHVPY